MWRRFRINKSPESDRDYGHLTLLAKDEEGYRNLVKLVSIAHLDGFYYRPRVDKELLRAIFARIDRR